jgi:hypothetical protein
VAGELLAGQVNLGPIRKPIPPVDPLPAAIAAQHLGHEQFAAEQVVDGQRGRPALTSGRVRGGPVTGVHWIAGIAGPGGAHRGLDVFPRDGCHAYMLATLAALRMTSPGFEAYPRIRMVSGRSRWLYLTVAASLGL